MPILQGAWLRPQVPALILAPMEGVTCPAMRALVTEVGGVSLCVAPYLRISQQVPPAATFLRLVPELRTGGRTPAGVPVVFQLLGGDADKLARAAQLACELGAPGIDLNFGCPARTVNRHDGGAAILRAPARLRDIVRTVRLTVPRHVPVTAKLRLGWDDAGCIHANADMVAEAGVASIVIHGRTRAQGYRPFARWRPVAQVRQRLPIPVVVNGDIFDVDGLARCQAETGCTHFMVGRGAVAHPGWLRAAAQALGAPADTATPPAAGGMATGCPPPSLAALMSRFVQLSQALGQGASGGLPGRLKQWAHMAFLRGHFPQFADIKRLSTTDAILDGVERLC